MLIAGLTDYVKRRQAEVGVRITQRTPTSVVLFALGKGW